MLEQLGTNAANFAEGVAKFQDGLKEHRAGLLKIQEMTLERARAVDDEIKELRSAFSRLTQTINDLEATNQGLMKELSMGLDKTIAGTDELIGEAPVQEKEAA